MDEVWLVNMIFKREEKEKGCLQGISIYFVYSSMSPETKTNTVIARYESSS